MKNEWITFGSHTKTHPFLPEVSETKKIEEIAGSKEDLENWFGVPFHYFSYPFGNLDTASRDTVKRAGYRLGVTTSYKKLKGLEEGAYALTRTKITRSSDNPFIFWIKVSGLYQAFKGLRYRIKVWQKGLTTLRN